MSKRYTPKKKAESSSHPYTDSEIEIMAQIQRAIRKKQPIKGAPEGYNPDDPSTWT